MSFTQSQQLYNCPSDALVGDAVYISAEKTLNYADASDPTKYAVGVISGKVSTTTCFIVKTGQLCQIPGLTTNTDYYLTTTATAGNTLSTTESGVKIGKSIDGLHFLVKIEDGFVWDDLRVPLERAGTGGGGNAPTWAAINGGIQAWRFDDGGTDILYFSAQLPHDYREGSAIHPHIHVIPTANASAPNNKSLWTFEYAWANIDGKVVGTTVDSVLMTIGASDSDTHKFWEFTEISGEGKLVSSVIECTLSRVGGDGTDTYTGNIFALEFDFHYQKDTRGSNSELVK